MFTRIALAALVAGLIAGAVVTVVHAIGTSPLILAAETYESAEATGHDHDEAAWAPADGLERLAYTAGADLVVGVGFAFLLVGAFALRGRAVGWRDGLLWGLAGFAVFGALPALGLPPEVPGTVAAPLGERQAWWFATVVASAIGLAALAFGRGWAWKTVGVVLIVLPHAIGAPTPEEHGGLAPEELAHAYIAVSLATTAIFWLVLGAVAGVAYDRFGPRAAA